MDGRQVRHRKLWRQGWDHTSSARWNEVIHRTSTKSFQEAQGGSRARWAFLTSFGSEILWRREHSSTLFAICQIAGGLWIAFWTFKSTSSWRVQANSSNPKHIESQNLWGISRSALQSAREPPFVCCLISPSSGSVISPKTTTFIAAFIHRSLCLYSSTSL